ncbi:carbonic anhydrase [Halalkalibacter akibai]|uniref:carbonic anhydrase n=1 Tax=Halalkalibacter akibai (strain ATCC 43226 / DSM 21942 / CIP 109018 / JCM 9157 / 1139) TaxID=1236973 RepID=W4QPN1_HALA3|nr:carbonic anhydrase [Halalkalibacter akibai]GAE34021.1 carbonic anhydrase [Halalkalibacter akibai JCM 9157]
MEKLKENNRQFVSERLEHDPSYFHQLKQGQHPDYFVLSCSDSRVCPSVITKMPLGNLFSHRNVGNQVSENDESFRSSLYFALKVLKVKKILIIGHTGCSGVKFALEDHIDDEVVGWINQIKASLPKERTRQLSLEKLAEINVIAQTKNLKKHPLYLKYGERVTVIGCLFHVESGDLEILENED